MTPFSNLASAVSSLLLDRQFEPLDAWEGKIGGDRYGVYDHTWISPRQDGHHLYASLFIGERETQPPFIAEVWAAVEYGSASPRSMVLRSAPFYEPNRELEAQLQHAMVDAVERAKRLSNGSFEDLPPNESSARLRPDPLARAPQAETTNAVYALFFEQPEREWRNRDVLRTLIEREFPTDRASVNAALADLAYQGYILRLGRGRYVRGRG